MAEPQTAPKPAVVPQSLDAGTSYLVLKRDGEKWQTVNTTSARSTDAAIKAVVVKLAETDQAGEYVAVPSRSWTPQTVKPKVERSLVVEAVKS